MAYANDVLADSPWGFWPGVPGAGSLADASPNGHNLTISGSSYATITGPDGSSAISWTGSYGNNGTAINSNTAQTFECWIYLDTVPAARIYLATLGNGVNGNGGYSSIYIEPDSTVNAQAWTSTNYVTASPGPITVGAWHHIVATSSDLMRLYIDGNLVATGVAMGGNWTRSLFLPGTPSVKMAYPAYYYGLALPQARVTDHYNAMNLLRINPVGNQVSPLNQAINLALSAVGGTTPYTWAASNLPNGLTINASTGAISGTTTTAQQGSVSITVTDASSHVANTSFIWTVTADTYAQSVLSDSPLAYWRLDDPSGTTMADFSGYSRNATYAGSPTLNGGSLLPSTTDASVHFNRSSTASIASANWMNVGSNLSLEAWVKLDDATGGEVISRDNNGAGGTSSSFRIRTNNSVFQFLFWHSGLTVLGGNTVPVPGKVYHMVATYDGTTAKLYINGQLDNSVAATGAIVNSNMATYISTLQGSSAENFAGYMDELAIYGTALPASRVQTHYTAAGYLKITQPNSQVTKLNQTADLKITSAGGVAPYTWSATDLPPGLTINTSTGEISGTVTAKGNFMPSVTQTDSSTQSQTITFPWVVTDDAYTYAVLSDSPMSHWGFEETSGTTVDDDQTTTRDGTVNGGVTLNQPISFPGAGLGAKFDGTSGYVSFGNAGGFLGLETIEVVAEFDSIPTTSAVNPLFSNAYPGAQIIPLVIGFNLDAGHVGQLQAGYYTGSAWVTATSSVVPTVGQAYHVVATYDATNLTLWLNGVQVASVAASNRPVSGTVNATAYIGRRWDTAQFHAGTIWDVAIYGTPLSSSQITTHYNAVSDDHKPPAFSGVQTYPNNGNLTVLYELSQGYAVPLTISVTGSVNQTVNTSAGKSGTFTLAGFTSGQAVNLTLSPSNTYGAGTAQNVSLTYTPNAYDNAVQADGPAVFYDTQETSGTVSYERMNGLDGNYQGTVVLNDTTDPAAPANLGNHVSLNGANGYLQLAPGTWFMPATSGFSFEGNFYVRSWSNWARVFDFAPGPSIDDMYLAANSSGTMSLKVAGGSISFARFPTGQWIHLAVTVSSAGNAVVYFNGTVYATGKVGAPVNQTRSNMYIGRSAYPADPYLATSMSHVSVYNSVLTASQVANHAELALPYVTAQLNAIAVESLNVMSYPAAQLNAITLESLNQVSYPAAQLNAIAVESLNQVTRPAAQLNAIAVEAIIKYTPPFVGWGAPL